MNVKAMVMDDDPRVCRALSRVITKSGFDAITLSDPQKFMATLAKEKPDLLFLDLNMPNVDGVKLLSDIPLDFPIAVHIISGVDPSVLASTYKMDRARNGLVKGVITKPFDWSKIIELLVSAKVELESAGFLRNSALSPNAYPKPAIPITEKDLDNAIKNLQIKMNYQPKIALDTGKIVGVEALARWIHPTFGNVPPMLFIPFAESSGQILELTKYLFNYAISDFSILKKRFGEDLKLAFNVSACILGESTLPDILEQCVEKHSLQAGSIILEVTETASSQDKVKTMEILSRFRIKGFELSMDDFGTGYSTLLQLLDYPFSELKIDRSFIIGLQDNKDSESRIIVESTLKLAEKFGLKTVAEGIEDSETLKWLATHGCREGQGYFISKPQSIINLLKWYDEYTEKKRKESETHAT